MDSGVRSAAIVHTAPRIDNPVGTPEASAVPRFMRRALTHTRDPSRLVPPGRAPPPGRIPGRGRPSGPDPSTPGAVMRPQAIVALVALALFACGDDASSPAASCEDTARASCTDAGGGRGARDAGDRDVGDAASDADAPGCADERATCTGAAEAWTCACRFARDEVATFADVACADALGVHRAVCPLALGDRVGPACTGYDGTLSTLPFVLALYNDAQAAGAPMWLALTSSDGDAVTVQPLGVEPPWGDAASARQRVGSPGTGTFVVEANGRFTLVIEGFDVQPGVLPADWSTDTWRVSGELTGTLVDGWTGCGDGYLQIATRSGVETLRFDVAARSTSLDPVDFDASLRTCEDPLGGCFEIDER